MAEGIPARLSHGQAVARGRKFGLTVGTAFLLLATIAAWRGALRTATILGAIGGLLLCGALLIPARLGPVERAWMGLAHAMSKVTTPVFMGVLYFGLFTPFGRVKQLFSGRGLSPPKAGGSFWFSRDPADRRGDLERQF